jgi:hypothetical protein
MIYEEIKAIKDQAWVNFFSYVALAGMDVDKLKKDMNNKDCFNDVMDCFMNQCEVYEE